MFLTTSTRALVVGLGATGMLFAGATAALADYSSTATVTAKTYLGANGVDGAYKFYAITVGGHNVCMHTSSYSPSDPLDSNTYSRVFIRYSTGGGANGGFQDVTVGASAKILVNESASPSLCGGRKLAYQVFIYV